MMMIGNNSKNIGLEKNTRRYVDKPKQMV